MFEGHIKALGLGEAEETSVLRRLRWTDLVARLEATRELRAEMERSQPSNFASFTVQPERGENGKRGVNQDVLSHGKAVRRRPVAVANDASHGDRDSI